MSSEVSVKSLLESGVHFGHQVHRWNPKMAPYLFGKRAGVHIIDLDQTLGYLHQAQAKVTELTAGGGLVLFVGTKRQGKEAIKAAAERAGMPYVTERWLGGLLTNFPTIEQRLKRLAKLTEGQQQGDWERLPKKEQAQRRDEHARLTTLLGGIRELSGIPAAVYVSDVVREDLAVREARKLQLPVIGVLDSNADPRQIDYPIPGNDDAVKAISLIADAIADAALAGRTQHQAALAKTADQAAAELAAAEAERAATAAKAGAASE